MKSFFFIISFFLIISRRIFGFNFVSYPVVFCTTSVNSRRGGGWVKEKNVGRKQWGKRLSLFCPFPLFGFLTASAWFNWTVVGRHSGSILCSYLSSYFVAVVHTVVTMFLFLFFAPAPASVASDCWTSLSPSLYPCLVLSSSDTRRTQKMRKWKGRAPEMKCLGRGRRWNSGRLACWEERMLRSIDFFFLSPPFYAIYVRWTIETGDKEEENLKSSDRVVWRLRSLAAVAKVGDCRHFSVWLAPDSISLL